MNSRRMSPVATRQLLAATRRQDVAMGASLIFTHISEHARLEIPMDLRDLRAFSPPRPASGRGGRGVRGRALTW